MRPRGRRTSPPARAPCIRSGNLFKSSTHEPRGNLFRGAFWMLAACRFSKNAESHFLTRTSAPVAVCFCMLGASCMRIFGARGKKFSGKNVSTPCGLFCMSGHLACNFRSTRKVIFGHGYRHPLRISAHTGRCHSQRQFTCAGRFSPPDIYANQRLPAVCRHFLPLGG